MRYASPAYALLALAASGDTAAGAIRWEPLYEPGVGGAIVSVQVSPHDARHVLAGGDMLGTGVSFDGGETWRPGMGLATYEMATATFHPSKTNEVWIGSCSGPYKSIDGGLTWEWKRKGMPAPARNRYTMMIEKVLFDPRDSSRMLAFSGSSRHWGKCSGFGAVWESSDGGESWSRTGTVTTNGWTSESVEGANIVQAFWGAKPACDSEARQVHVVAEGAGWFSSMDGGRTWRHRATPGIDGSVASVTAHPSDSRVFWVVTSPGEKGEDGKVPPGGIYKTVDGGRSFSPCDAGIARRGGARSKLATHFSQIAVSASNPDRLYVGDASWNSPAIWKSDDGGATRIHRETRRNISPCSVRDHRHLRDGKDTGTMKIFDTMTKYKEDFVPLEPGKVRMYVCGPTVYNFIHIGNARPMIFFDTVRRYFLYKGYDVNYVSNFTDVDDKIIKAAVEEGVDSSVISERYIRQKSGRQHVRPQDSEGNRRRGQGGSQRLRSLEAEEGRGALLGVPLVRRKARLAHRVLCDEQKISG